MTALWINNPGFDTDHRHRHRGGMLTKTPPPTEVQIPATVTTLFFFASYNIAFASAFYPSRPQKNLSESSAFYTFENLQVRNSADPHFTGG